MRIPVKLVSLQRHSDGVLISKVVQDDGQVVDAVFLLQEVRGFVQANAFPNVFDPRLEGAVTGTRRIIGAVQDFDQASRDSVTTGKGLLALAHDSDSDNIVLQTLTDGRIVKTRIPWTASGDIRGAGFEELTGKVATAVDAFRRASGDEQP